jgi:hypothetical protein
MPAHQHRPQASLRQLRLPGEEGNPTDPRGGQKPRIFNLRVNTGPYFRRGTFLITRSGTPLSADFHHDFRSISSRTAGVKVRHRDHRRQGQVPDHAGRTRNRRAAAEETSGGTVSLYAPADDMESMGKRHHGRIDVMDTEGYDAHSRELSALAP